MSSSEDEEVILLINKNIEHGSIFRVHKKLINVIILGLSLMFIFTAFQTCSMIEVCTCIICYEIAMIIYSFFFKQYLIFYLLL